MADVAELQKEVAELRAVVESQAGLRDEVESFVHKELVPSGVRVLVTSRPEGVEYVAIYLDLVRQSTDRQRLEHDHGQITLRGAAQQAHSLRACASGVAARSNRKT